MTATAASAPATQAAEASAPADTAALARSPIRWVPSLYFVKGLRFFVVMLIAGLMFKNMGIANEQIARAGPACWAWPGRSSR